jgi:hypothetical protein
MSMTTELRGWLLALPLIALGWLGTLALVMRLGGETPAALVLFPPEGLVAALPDGVAVVGAGPVSLTLAGGEGLEKVLRDLGAVLILPAGLEGCLPTG